MTRVAVVGEALVDIVDGAAHPGGSPLNVAVGLGRLGLDVELFTRIGADEHGLAIMVHLQDSHVRLAKGSVAHVRTPTAHAHIAPDGSARYEFDIVWDIPAPVLGAPDIVHIGSLGAYLEPGASHVASAIERASAKALITFDPNIRPGVIGDHSEAVARTAELVERSDVVKLSEEDAAWLFPGTTNEEVLQQIAAHGPRLAVITRAAQGCVARANGETFRLPAVPASVADTIGAGDAFMSGLIAALAGCDGGGETGEGRARLMDWRAILFVALSSSAWTVSRSGAEPPHLHELPSLATLRRAASHPRYI